MVWLFCAKVVSSFKVKIFFNRVPIDGPWGGGNQFLREMISTVHQAGHEITHQLSPDVDVIFMIDPRPGNTGYSVQHIAQHKQLYPHTKVLHRVNECDLRKGTSDVDQLLLASMSMADRVVFISQWLKDYFLSLEPVASWKDTSTVVYNGCNVEHFYPGTKLLTAKTKLVTHHWSDNWMKGFDLYTEIDRHLAGEPEATFEFTYVGRYNKGYMPKATTIVDPLHGAALGAELRKHDVYVTASRWEPCGMHHVEGAACGLPVLYHNECGGINELCCNHGEEFSDFDGFLEKLSLVRENYGDYVDSIQLAALDITNCCGKFMSILESL